MKATLIQPYEFNSPTLTFRADIAGAPVVYSPVMSQGLAEVIQEMRKTLGAGQILHLGIYVDRLYPRRPDGSTIFRRHDGEQVITGHHVYCAIDMKKWGGADYKAIYKAAMAVKQAHPEFALSVVKEPGWCHLEWGYPHVVSEIGAQA